MAVSDWSTTANSNTAVGGIGITGGSAVSQGDNALREIMAQIKAGVPYLSGTTYILAPSAAGAVGIAFPEDSDNGSNKVTLKAAESLAADYVVTLPSATGTLLGTSDLGKQTIWVPAAAMIPRTTNGAAAGVAEMSSNKNMVRTLDFDATTQEFAQFDVRMPKSWNEGTVTFIPVWSHAATTTNFGVVFGLDAVAISNDDALDVAFGTEQTSTDTGGTTNDSYQGPESAAVTIAGTPAVGDLVQFRIHRNPSDGSDTMAIDARLHGVIVLYTIDTLKDD